MGVPVSVERRDLGSGVTADALPGSCIVVANHASYLDGMVLASVLPGPLSFVAKKELERQRIAGPFLRALGTLFVERADPAAGVADASRVEVSADREAVPLIVFPEGTFTRAPGLLPFRMGAFVLAAHLGRPVLPVVIQGTRSVLRGDQWFPRRGEVRVIILPPLEAGGRDFGSAVRLMEATRTQILAHCGEPDVDGS